MIVRIDLGHGAYIWTSEQGYKMFDKAIREEAGLPPSEEEVDELFAEIKNELVSRLHKEMEKPKTYLPKEFDNGVDENDDDITG